MDEPPKYADPPAPAWRTALLRLWLLRPVTLAPAGSALYATLVMGTIWLSFWIAIDRWQSQPEPQFFPSGIPLLAWHLLAILGLAALLRSRARPAPAFASALALSMGAVPVPLLFTSVVVVYIDPSWLPGAAILVCLYLLAYFAGGLHALTGQRQRAAACAGLVFVAAFVWLTDTLDVIPDVWTPLETQAAEPQSTTADAEAVLFAQSGRIDRSLSAIGLDASPNPRAFFLGFAGVGDEKVFAQEIGLASRVLGERYDIAGREVSLINDQRDLESAPLATVSGLRYALRGLGSRMNVDRDVLFLSVSSHGSEDPAIAVANADLPLEDLSDEDLAGALRESGIKWRVIIISACYAGGFIDRLSDPQTIVITAAAADRTSFGCSSARDLTYFGEAFYRDALPAAHSLRDAFDAAKTALTARERREHITPSNPQAYFGSKMEAKLAAMNGAHR
jgi:Peptidase C13 family